MVIPGGHSEPKDIIDSENDEDAKRIQEKVLTMKSQAEAMLGRQQQQVENLSFERFDAVQYRRQIVAGTIYHVKVLVSNNNDEDAVHIKLFEPLPYENKPMELQMIQRANRHDDLAIMH